MATVSETIGGVPLGKTLDTEPFQTGSVATVAAAHAIHDTYTAFLPPLLPVLIAKFALSTTQAGLLNVFMQWPSLLQPFIGYLADYVSLRYFVILTPAITASLMSLLGVAPSYAVMSFLLIGVGLSSAGLHAVAPVMAGNLSGHKLGRGMGFWAVGGELGRTVGPLAVVSAVAILGLAGTAWLMIAGWLASALLYLRLRYVPGRPADMDQARPWRQALQVMRPVLMPLSGIILARSFIVAASTTYLPTFLSREGHSFWLAGASMSVLEAAGVAGALIGGSLSDRLSRKLVLLITSITPPVLLLVFLAAQGWVRVPLLVLHGFTLLAVMPVIMAVVQESFPQNRALANGIYMAVSFLTNSVAIVAVGALGDIFGLRTAFAASTAVTLVSLPLIALLPGRRPRTAG